MAGLYDCWWLRSPYTVGADGLLAVEKCRWDSVFICQPMALELRVAPSNTCEVLPEAMFPAADWDGSIFCVEFDFGLCLRRERAQEATSSSVLRSSM